MAYHEELITGRTDATGNATIQLGPVSQYEDVWFLGYVIAECVDGSSANYRLFNPLSGAKLGGFAGQMAVVGPMLLKPQQNLSLLVNAGPPNTPITGALVGDVHADPNQLALRPIPTAAGANVGLPSFPSITVTGSADVQGLATFEGNVEFKGPDPWIDPLNPAYGAKGDGVTLDTAAIQLAANAAGGGKKLRFAPGFAFYTGGFTISSGTVVEANGATIKLANGGQSTLLLFQDQPHTDTQIQGGIWDGNGGGQAGAGSAAVIHGGSGINTSHNRTRISDVVVLNAGQHGLFLSTQDHATNPKWITRCVVSDHGIKAIGYGIYIDYCPATFIEGCWVNAVSNTNDNFELGHLGQSTMLGCISIGGQIQFPFADDTRIIGCLQINNTIQNDGNTANRVVLLGCTVLNAAPAAGLAGSTWPGRGRSFRAAGSR